MGGPLIINRLTDKKASIDKSTQILIEIVHAFTPGYKINKNNTYIKLGDST